MATIYSEKKRANVQNQKLTTNQEKELEYIKYKKLSDNAIPSTALIAASLCKEIGWEWHYVLSLYFYDACLIISSLNILVELEESRQHHLELNSKINNKNRR